MMKNIIKEVPHMRICYVIIAAISLILISCTPQISPTTAPAALRILTENYPPYNFADKNGNVAGQSTEIIQAIMEKVGAQSSIEIVPLAQGLSETQSGPLTAMYSINRTEQREH